MDNVPGLPGGGRIQARPFRTHQISEKTRRKKSPPSSQFKVQMTRSGSSGAIASPPRNSYTMP